MSKNDESPVRVLLADYKKLNFFKRWFFPGALAQALECFEMAKGEANQRAATNDVYHAFAIHTGLITRWLFTCLGLFEKETTGLRSPNTTSIIDKPVVEPEPSETPNDTPDDQQAIFIRFSSFFTGEHAAANKNAISEYTDLENLFLNLEAIEGTGLLSGEHAQAHFEAIVSSHEDTLNFLGSYALEQDNLLKGSEGQEYFKIIREFFEDPTAPGYPGLKISKAQRTLQDFKLLTPSRFQNAIWDTEIDTKGEILELLGDKQLLMENDTPDYFGKVLQIYSPADFKSTIIALKKIDCLTQENIEALLTASPTWHAALSSILLPLDKAKVLILSSNGPVFFHLLDRIGLLEGDQITVENKQSSSQMLTLEDFIPALSRLSKAKLLDKSNSAGAYVEMLLQANAPDEFADGIIFLADATLLNHWRVIDCFSSMITSTKPKHIAETIRVLHQVDLLNNGNMLKFFASLMSFDKLNDYLPALNIVHGLRLLTNQDGRANFDKLIQLIKNKGCASIVSTLELFQKVGLLKKVSEWHNNSVFKEQLSFHPNFINIFKMLDERNVFNDKNAIDYFWLITPLKEEQNVQGLESSLTLLNSANLLQGEHIFQDVKAVVTLISKVEDPTVVTSNLKTLHDKKVLTHENLETMVLARSPEKVVPGILILHEAGLAQQCRKQIICCDTPEEWASGLVILNKAALLGTPFQKTIRSISPLEQGVILLKALYSAGLLTNENKDENVNNLKDEIIKAEYWRDELKSLLRLLQRPELFTGEDSQANFDRLMANMTSLVALDSIIQTLEKLKLLTESKAQKNFETLVTKSRYDLPQHKAIFLMLETVLSKSEDVQHYFDLIVNKIRHLETLTVSLEKAVAANLFDGEDAEKNLALILQKGISKKERNISMPEGTYGTVEGMIILNKIGLLNDTTRKAMAFTKLPHSFATAVSALHTTNLFKGENALSNLKLLSNNVTDQLVSLLTILCEAGILEEETQTRFSTVMRYVKALVSWSHVFYNVPTRLLTVNIFNRVIGLAQTHQANPYEAFNIIQRALNAQFIDHADQEELNNAQSTHTASVHASTDLTLWLLHAKYASRNFPETAWKEIADRLESVREKPTEQATDYDGAFIYVEKTSDEIEAAKRCLKRLGEQSINLKLDEEKRRTSFKMLNKLNGLDEASIQRLFHPLGILPLDSKESSDYSYEKGKKYKLALPKHPEKEFKVIPLKTFILWLYEEIKGKENSMEALIRALHEIQRGYNLSKKGEDNKSKGDLPICVGGTANKFSECLSSLSVLIKFIYITNKTIMKKLRQEVINAVANHCKKLKDEGKVDELNAVMEAFENTNREQASSYIEIIYSNNYKPIIASIKDEFEDLVPGLEKLIQDFTAAVGSVEISTEKLPKIENGATYAPDNFFQPSDETVGEFRLNLTSSSIR